MTYRAASGDFWIILPDQSLPVSADSEYLSCRK